MNIFFNWRHLITLTALSLYADCPDLFFVCVGKNIPASIMRPFWTHIDALQLKKITNLAFDKHYPLVNIGQSFITKKLSCRPQYPSHNSPQNSAQGALEYTQSIVCRQKFGAGSYEACPVPSITCNLVYALIDGTYQLMIEPADPRSTVALQKAYIDSGTKALRRLMPGGLNKLLSEGYRLYASSSQSIKSIDSFMAKFGFEPSNHTWIAKNKDIARKADAFGINPAEWAKSREEYTSFNDFFVKKLKPGARAIADEPKAIVAPADSKLMVISPVDNATTFFGVKDEKFTLNKFLGDAELAHQFRGGTLMIFRLSPYNYHRFHFPVTGIPTAAMPIKTLGYESVDPITYKTGINPLTINKRQLVTINTSHGNVLMVIVGAFNVGTINTTYTTGNTYQKGAELGYFSYGGSTVTVLFKPDTIKILEALTQHCKDGFETAVKMGEKVAEFIP